MGSYILVVDQGTTSSHAIVFDAAQRIAGIGRMEFTQHTPEPGWVEHMPEEIWATCLWSAKTALRRAGIAATDLAAVSITNQRETTVIWDRATSQPIHNAIVWQDRRTTPICDACVGKVSNRSSPKRPAYYSTPTSPGQRCSGSSTT